ncbi:addiction module toxin RelE [Clostridium sp. UBA1652]|uniref:addiction module toxin RelE n=1 Tax=Clostridium sp. UBA1652 TaxID=1946348 RepID=UPI00257D71FF|nr:addiction module toxin RelE [Clostridium sp. UBA1652]
MAAVKKVKYKRLTNAEKKFNKDIREQLREDGILPPIKPKLNRKKFSKEVIEEFKEFGSYSDLRSLYEAISWMLPSDIERKVTPEQIGLVKTLKLALEIKKFKEKKEAEGLDTYKVEELYEEVVKPIKNL